MGFKGNIESFSLADVFQNLAMNSQTGTLRITPERNPNAEEKYVYFQDGHVRFLSGSSRAPLLPPEVFVARGLLSKSEFDAVLLRQAESNEALVACLLGMGYVNEQQIQDLLVHQIEEEIYDLFGWEAASFEFNEGPPPEGLFAAEAAETGWGINIQIAHLIMEAARRVDEWERLRKVIPSHKEIFVVDLTVRKAIERGEMETDPVERRVAMLIDGARDVDDVIEDSKLFKFEVIGALSGFLQSSIIRPATLNELNFSEGECARLDLPKRRVKVLERILALGGENLRIRRELADLMSKMGQTEHACIHYSILAAAELKDGHEEGAIEIFKRILSIAPANVKTREALAALYAKRQQKRDAFVQYSELFENLRDQHFLREARDAASHALENDPTNAKMRNALVELLLMEDRQEDAAVQLEQLGDFAARSRNTQLAADAYRRAMQYRKNSRPLKKKLNEVLLTKEDRAARRRRLSLSVFFLSILLLAFGAIYYIEMENSKKYDAARRVFDASTAEAEQAEAKKDLAGARDRIALAADKLKELKSLWSPFNRLTTKVESDLAELKRLDEKLATKIDNQRENAARRRTDLDIEAKQAFTDSDFTTAKERYRKLLDDPTETDDEKTRHTAELAKVEAAIAEYAAGLKVIKQLQRNPTNLFKSAAEELNFVDTFYKKYYRTKQEDFPRSFTFPILITPNVDEVEVSMDGNPIADSIVRADAPWEARVRRYIAYQGTSTMSHKFKFTKRGYTGQEEDTFMHRTPGATEIKVVLERKPAIQKQFDSVQFDGDARYFNGLLYAGTSEGSLLEIDVASESPAITARFDLDQPLAAVDKKVYGQIYTFQKPGQAPLFVYCTKSGYCVGLTKKDGKFDFAWAPHSQRVLESGQPMLNFPPTYFEQKGKPKIALVVGSHIVVVDAESGSTLSMTMEMPKSAINDKPVAPTSGACYIDRDGGMLGVAGSDSNIHVFALANATGKPKREIWQTDMSKLVESVKVTPVVIGETLVVAGDNGSIRFFNFNGGRDKEERIAVGGITAPPLVEGRRLFYACSGMPRKEGLTLLDMGSSDRPIKNGTAVPLTLTPASMPSAKRVYFVTSPPGVMLYAIDAKDFNSINTVFWKYKIDRKVACPPIVGGSRVFVLTADGGIIGFDEPR